jgi:hypothetical protein
MTKKLFAANESRAIRAEKALSAYENNAECNVTDLITDLRHFCDREEIDFDAAVEMSEIHHEEEVNGR